MKKRKSDHPWYFLTDGARRRPTPLCHGQRPVQVRIPSGRRALDALVAAADDKRTDCAHYEECLTHAACRDWQQFSCGSCEVYRRDPELSARDERLADTLDFLYAGPDVGGDE